MNKILRKMLLILIVPISFVFNIKSLASDIRTGDEIIEIESDSGYVENQLCKNEDDIINFFPTFFDIESVVQYIPVTKISNENKTAFYSYDNESMKSKTINDCKTEYKNNILNKIISVSNKNISYNLFYNIAEMRYEGILYNEKYYVYEYDVDGNVKKILLDDEIVCEYEYDDVLAIPNNDSLIGQINPIRYQDFFWDVDMEIYYVGNGVFYNPNTHLFIQNDYSLSSYAYNWLQNITDKMSISQSAMNNILNEYTAAMNNPSYGSKQCKNTTLDEYQSGKRWYSGLGDIETVARCIYSENNYKDRTSDRTAIATVIMNRKNANNCSAYLVVTKPKQFSSINPGAGINVNNNSLSVKNKSDVAWQQATLLSFVLANCSSRDDINLFYKIPSGISNQMNFRALNSVSVGINGNKITINNNAKNDVAIAGYGILSSQSDINYINSLVTKYYNIFYND